MYRFMMTMVALVTTLACLSCKPQSERPATKNQTSTTSRVADTLDAGEIQKRVEEMFHDVYQAYASASEHDAMPSPEDFDTKYGSKEYLELLHKALAIGERDTVAVIDADHWSQSQDPQDPKMSVKRVYDLDASRQTAKADVEISVTWNRDHPTLVTLWLTRENSDWKIDNWVQVFEGKTLDEKAWLKEFVDNDGYPIEP